MTPAQEYTDTALKPTLQRGLVALCQARPDDPRTWLAEWLLANKPPPKLALAGSAAAVQAVIEMYSSSEGKAQLQGLWSALDKDGDGTITSKEWGKGVAANWKTMSKFFGGCTIAEAGKAFKSIDVDGSGDLTWEEFEGAISGMDATIRLAQALATQEGAKELKALFESLDKNGDGRVTGKEWGSAVSKNKDMMSKFFGGKDLKSIGKAFKTIDADGSGDLTWEEFVSGSKRAIAAL